MVHEFDSSPYSQASFPADLGSTTGISLAISSVPGTDYNTIPLKGWPFWDHAMPLGDHFNPATNENLWKKYVDLFELRNREVDKKHIDEDDEREKERARRYRQTRPGLTG